MLHMRSLIFTNFWLSIAPYTEQWFVFLIFIKELVVVILFLIYLALAIILGVMAKGAGRSFWVWFVIGMVLTPLMAYLIFFVLVKGK